MLPDLSLAAQDLKTAQNILKNPDAYEQLSFAQYLDLISEHENLILELLKQDDFRNVVDGYALSILAQKHLSVATAIFNDPVLKKKLKSPDIVEIAGHHESIGLALLESKTFLENIMKNQIRGEHLSVLGKHHPSIATKIIENPKLISQMDGTHLAMLGLTNLKIAMAIVLDEKLLRKLDIDDLALLGQAHEPIAIMILYNPKLSQYLEGENYSRLGKNHENIAFTILRQKNVRALGNNIGLARLAQYNVNVGKAILIDPFWSKVIDGVGLSILGETHGELAEIIFNNKALWNKLDLNQKVSISKKSTLIADHLFNTMALKNLLEGLHLKILGQYHPHLAQKILTSNKLMLKLGPDQMGYLGLKDLNLAKHMMETQATKERLGVHSIGVLCHRYLGVNQMTIKDNHLFSKLSEEYKFILMRRMHTVKAVSQYIKSKEAKNDASSNAVSDIPVQNNTLCFQFKPNAPKQKMPKKIERNEPYKLESEFKKGGRFKHAYR